MSTTDHLGATAEHPPDPLFDQLYQFMSQADRLPREEGRRPKPYDDATGKELVKGQTLEGKLTAGVGRNLSDVGLSDDEIDLMLKNDLRRAVQWLDRQPQFSQWRQTLNFARQYVLTDMAFNLEGHLLGFTDFIRALEQGDYVRAAGEMLDSQWAKQVGQRAADLSQIMLMGSI